ncbi:MAG: hypothetical protein ACK5MG_00115 [Bacteroidales bacterium]
MKQFLLLLTLLIAFFAMSFQKARAQYGYEASNPHALTMSDVDMMGNMIIKCKSSYTSITIPAAINGVTVKIIGHAPFVYLGGH